MSLLFRVLHANKCTSTHHKLAMDALLQLESIHAAQWQNLFIKNVEIYLDGSKAPDTKFKDFRNHVLHVNDNYWGGAVVKAEEWYQRLCEFLREEDWPRAVYAAGVMSHYITDPFMPLHTAQSEAEGAVHRAAEWSVTKSYDSLIESLVDELGGYQSLSLSHTDDWLALAIISGARQANQHYETLIDHYNLEVGSKRPEEGLDQECRDFIAKLLGSATMTVARVLDRAFDVTGVSPPETNVTLAGYLTTVSTPVFWITKKLANSKDKAVVNEIYREVQLRNRAIESLPQDERTVRALHAEEVLGVSEADLENEEPRQTGTKFRTGTPDRRAVAEPEYDEEPLDETVAEEDTRIKTGSDEHKTAAAEETAADIESEPNAPSKFGQSAWRERRQARREAAEQKAALKAEAKAAQRAEREAQKALAAQEAQAALEAEEAAAELAAQDAAREAEKEAAREAAKQAEYEAAEAAERTRLAEQQAAEEASAAAIAAQTAAAEAAEIAQADAVVETTLPTEPIEADSPRGARKIAGVMAAASSLAATFGRKRAVASDDQPGEPDHTDHSLTEPAELDQFAAAAAESEREQARSQPIYAASDDYDATDTESSTDADYEESTRPKRSRAKRRTRRNYEASVEPVESDEPEYEAAAAAAESSDYADAQSDYEQPADPYAEPEAELPVEQLAASNDEAADDEPVIFERVEQEERGPRFFLELDSPIVDAPSIGGGTAKRLRKAGIRKVSDLLECDVELIAEATRASYVTEESLTEWQNQSRLQCRVPGLRGHDAQILVACGLSDPDAICQMTPDAILEVVEPFATSTEGERILRSSNPPDRAEITNWIEWSGLSRSLRAA